MSWNRNHRDPPGVYPRSKPVEKEDPYQRALRYANGASRMATDGRWGDAWQFQLTAAESYTEAGFHAMAAQARAIAGDYEAKYKAMCALEASNG